MKIERGHCVSSGITNKIIVLGGAHHNGLGIIRSLGEVGYSVYFISINSKQNFVTKSKYIKKWWSASEEDVISLIINIFGNEKHSPVILPSDDLTANILDSNYDKLGAHFIFPHVRNSNKKLSSLMNKEELNKLAIKHGFKVPTSKIIDLSSRDEDIIDAVINNVGIPCIIKPVQSIEGDKSDILVVEHSNQLIKTLSYYKGKYSRLLFQQYINKIGEVGIQGLSMYNSKEVKIAGVVKKIRISPTTPGSTTYAKLCNKFDLNSESKIISLIKDVKFCGIFDVELMFDKKDVYFIEVNFRNGAYGYAFTKANVNLPDLWCKEAIGIFNENFKRVEKPKVLMSELADFRNVLYKNVSLLRWIFDFMKTDVYLLLNISDIRPFLYKLKQKVISDKT